MGIKTIQSWTCDVCGRQKQQVSEGEPLGWVTFDTVNPEHKGPDVAEFTVAVCQQCCGRILTDYHQLAPSKKGA